jgi:hypothetical protein
VDQVGRVDDFCDFRQRPLTAKPRCCWKKKENKNSALKWLEDFNWMICDFCPRLPILKNDLIY